MKAVHKEILIAALILGAVVVISFVPLVESNDGTKKESLLNKFMGH